MLNVFPIKEPLQLALSQEERGWLQYRQLHVRSPSALAGGAEVRWTGTGTSSDRTEKDCRFLIVQHFASLISPRNLVSAHSATLHTPLRLSPSMTLQGATASVHTTARTTSTAGVRPGPPAATEVPTRRSAGQGKVRTGDRRRSEYPDGLFPHAGCRKVGGLADAVPRRGVPKLLSLLPQQGKCKWRWVGSAAI